jgi:hypothetical protein
MIYLEVFWQIIQGWFLYLSPSKESKERRAERMKHCKPCANNVKGVCVSCGCVLKAKTLVKDAKCDYGKW